MKTYNLAHNSNYHKSKFFKFLTVLLLIIKLVIHYIKIEH